MPLHLAVLSALPSSRIGKRRLPHSPFYPTSRHPQGCPGSSREFRSRFFPPSMRPCMHEKSDASQSPSSEGRRKASMMMADRAGSAPCAQIGGTCSVWNSRFATALLHSHASRLVLCTACHFLLKGALPGALTGQSWPSVMPAKHSVSSAGHPILQTGMVPRLLGGPMIPTRHLPRIGGLSTCMTVILTADCAGIA